MDCRSRRYYRINLADIGHAALGRRCTVGEVNVNPGLATVNDQYNLAVLRRECSRLIEDTMGRSELAQGEFSLAQS
jgi:hypothetical protein